MSLEVKSIFTGTGESQLILKRALPDGTLQVTVVGPNSQQLSYSLTPAQFLEGVRAVYPDLIVQLPS